MKEYKGKGTFMLRNGVTYPKYIPCLECGMPYLAKNWRDKLHPACRKRRIRKQNDIAVRKYNHSIYKNNEYVNEHAQRRCLRCGKMFDSEFNGNRICPQCKQNNNRMSPDVEGV